MKRMGGIILMLVGVVIFGIGMVFYLKKPKTNEVVANDAVAETTSIVGDNQKNTEKNSTAQEFRALNSNTAEVETNTIEVSKMIEIAIADGVLTNNERNVIKQFADEKGLDYEDIIKEAEGKILKLKANEAETKIIDYNKKNGNDFEKYIVQKFDKKYFKVQEWAGDKYVNGIYAKTTLQPDILFEFKLKDEKINFSVECKWRSSFYKNGIEIATTEQLNRYKEFEKSKNTPVFIAVGIGDSGASPKQLYIVPLKAIDTNFISIATLKQYEKKGHSNFFLDTHTKELR